MKVEQTIEKEIISKNYILYLFMFCRFGLSSIAMKKIILMDLIECMKRERIIIQSIFQAQSLPIQFNNVEKKKEICQEIKLLDKYLVFLFDSTKHMFNRMTKKNSILLKFKQTA